MTPVCPCCAQRLPTASAYIRATVRRPNPAKLAVLDLLEKERVPLPLAYLSHVLNRKDNTIAYSIAGLREKLKGSPWWITNTRHGYLLKGPTGDPDQ